MADLNTVRLIAQAEIPTVEVTILDSRFQSIHYDVGEVDVSLPPGTYLLQYKMGSSVTELPVVLRPGVERVTVPAPALSTRTPAPVAGTPAGDRYGPFPRDRSREVHVRHGEGGQLFIFIRRASKDLDLATSTESLFDVQVLDADLNVAIDMRRSGRRTDDGTSVACNVELTPGTYLLRYTSGPSETLEQTVVVCPGWQTLIFASSRRFGLDSPQLSPNFPEAAVFLVPQGDGFEPDDRNLVRSESARIALAGSCRVGPEVRLRAVAEQASQIRARVPEAQVAAELRSKFRSPMLGIYGAHLMLLNASPNWGVLRDIVAILKSLIGNHPDVVALTLRQELNEATDEGFYEFPPMLRNSWTLVVGDSTARPGLVPADAYAARVAQRLWGSGVWLVWHPPAPERSVLPGEAEGSSRETQADIQDAVAVLHRYVLDKHRTLGSAAFVKQVLADHHLNDIQRAFLVYAITTVHQRKTCRALNRPGGILSRAAFYVSNLLERYEWADRLTGGAPVDASVEKHLAPDRLVRTLGVPAAALNQAIVKLAHKVRRAAQAGS